MATADRSDDTSPYPSRVRINGYGTFITEDAARRMPPWELHIRARLPAGGVPDPQSVQELLDAHDLAVKNGEALERRVEHVGLLLDAMTRERDAGAHWKAAFGRLDLQVKQIRREAGVWEGLAARLPAAASAETLKSCAERVFAVLTAAEVAAEEAE